MTKADLIEKMAAASSCAKACAGKALDGAIEAITKAVKKGDRVALVGFGTFHFQRGKPGLGGILRPEQLSRLLPRNFRSFQQARLSRTQ